MKRSRVMGICVGLALAATQSPAVSTRRVEIATSRRNEHDDHGNHGRGNAPVSVTVSFGVGLNTAQPGNAVNHHILPRVIDVKAGGVVNFAVAGFHQIFAYKPGKGVDDVKIVDPAATFINDLKGIYYQGIVPGRRRLQRSVTTNPSNAVNRIESVGFFEPGVYLVIL